MSPGMINKIRLNNGGFAGRAKAVFEEFDNAAYLGNEAKEIGGGEIVGNQMIIEDAELHLAKQEDLCAMLDDALDTFLEGQRKLNTVRGKWLNTKLNGPNSSSSRSARINHAKVSRKAMKPKRKR